MISDPLKSHIVTMWGLESIRPQIEAGYQLLLETLQRGNKVMLCGNGGSAADCQHFAAELTGRYKAERYPLPAIALTTDTSALTAIANDYGYTEVFARQVRALGQSGDLLIGISTSGMSTNVIGALDYANWGNNRTILLTGGHDLSKMMVSVNVIIPVPSTETARIQEAHSFILHVWAEALDQVWKTS